MRRIRTLPAVLLLVAAVAGCGDSDPGPETVRGVVLEIEGDLTSVESFVIRTDSGDLLEVAPAPDGDFRFPLPHLHDHRRTSAPILVELDRTVDPPRAIAIQDADDPTWHGQAEEQATPERVIDLVIVDGVLEGGARRESVAVGDTVTLRVRGDSTDEIHVHGYDLYLTLVDGPAELTFEASIPGVFEIELEGPHTLLVRLEVN